MTDQFCMCGTQPGYLHTETCPFPFYGQSDVTQERWIRDNRELVKQLKAAKDGKQNLLAL
jgi:hypothetical protein